MQPALAIVAKCAGECCRFLCLFSREYAFIISPFFLRILDILVVLSVLYCLYAPFFGRIRGVHLYLPWFFLPFAGMITQWPRENARQTLIATEHSAMMVRRFYYQN